MTDSYYKLANAPYSHPKSSSTQINQKTLQLAQLSEPEHTSSNTRSVPERTFGYGEPGKSYDLIGSIIKGKYKIIDFIAEKRVSNVFRCERILIHDRVALKILFSELARDTVKVKRFHLEAVTTASIKHPNVITVYDFDFTDEGLPFIVTELLQGFTLFEEMRQAGRLSVERALQIITPICAALNVAHIQGIIHRDLKPSNIILHSMYDSTEVIKLIDFGIAKHLPKAENVVITAPGMFFGTPAYMAPEHCLGEGIDGRADIYSLGILLYEMLTGRLPFNAETPTKLMLKHIKETPPSPRSFCPELSTAIEKIILSAIAKEPEKRFPTTLEFAYMLNHTCSTY